VSTTACIREFRLTLILIRRYLRARKFVTRDAFQQFKDTEDWRKENKLDELYDTIDIHDYDETRRLVRSSMLILRYPT